LQAPLSRVFEGLPDFEFTRSDSSDAASQCRAMVSLIKSAHMNPRIAAHARGLSAFREKLADRLSRRLIQFLNYNEHGFFGLFFR
jgi:hypothetical protein